MPALVSQDQDDWTLGAFPEHSSDEVPPRAMEDGINVFIADDGLPYRRGGTAAFSNGMAEAVAFFWDGHLGAGDRTVEVDADSFTVGVLAGQADTVMTEIAYAD